MINRSFHLALSRLRPILAKALSALRPHATPLSPDERRKQRRLTIAGGISLFGAVAAFAVAPLAPDAALLPTQLVTEELTPPALAEPVAATNEQAQRYQSEERIRSGDSLASLLHRLGIADAAAERFIREDRNARGLYQLRPGRVVRAQTDGNGNLMRLVYMHTPAASESDPASPDRARALEIVRETSGFLARDLTLQHERRFEMRSGEISNSLYGATDAAGIPDAIANQIAEILSGDIDFHRDLRRGDQFRVIYEMYYQAGDETRPGRVLAVEFINNGKPYQAVWFQPTGHSGGYYGFDGKSMRRAFLRSPLEFSRISSGFGGRMHPISNIWRAHTGVDYAAPSGTPVRTTGDGTIEFQGSQSGYGNAVIVRHSGGNSTLYGHLSRFTPGMRAGTRVSQGQVIGFVGMTGWATGPHLHYEFRVNNRPLNPLTVQLPQSVPIEHDQLNAFRTNTADFGRRIELLRTFQSLGRSNVMRGA